MAKRSKRNFLSNIAAKWLEPRSVIGIAMAIFSFAIVESRAGAPAPHIRLADYSPMKAWERAEDEVICAKNGAVQYYENIRLVYQLTRRLKDLQKQRGPSQHEVPHLVAPQGKMPEPVAGGKRNTRSDGLTADEATVRVMSST